MAKNNVFVVVGLGLGDEGKGATTDYLARKYGIKTVVRFNGGSQAAHHVVTPEGIAHTFAQFGSGTLVPGVKTYLSRFMLVDPLSLIVEEKALGTKDVSDALERLAVSPYSVAITPFHSIINQMREICRGASRHGSCGKGVGEAVADAVALGDDTLFAGDFRELMKTRRKLTILWGKKVDLAEQMAAEHPDNKVLAGCLKKISDRRYPEKLSWEYILYFGVENRIDENDVALNIALQRSDVAFEGAQGVLLDPECGFRPYVTKTRTTLRNAEELLSEAEFCGRVIRLGVLRAYATRHGAGPLVTEDAELGRLIPDVHNGTNEWQGPFRIGWFDLVATRYALRVAGKIDALAITNLDRLEKFPEIKICTAYRCGSATVCDLTNVPFRQNGNLSALMLQAKPIYRSISKSEFIPYLEKELGVPVALASYGPTANDRVELRSLI